MTLALSIPQAALSGTGRDYIDPSRWDDGVPVLFSDYAFQDQKIRRAATTAPPVSI
jgi:outer membrane usher protein